MDCFAISEVSLDSDSLRGVEKIRNIRRFSQALAGTMAAGSLVTIFAGSKPPDALYNISSTNWTAFAKAMRGIPDIARNRIRFEAKRQFVIHGGHSKQQRFWRNVVNGCSAP